MHQDNSVSQKLEKKKGFCKDKTAVCFLHTREMSVLGETSHHNTVLLTYSGTNIDFGDEIWMFILDHT